RCEPRPDRSAVGCVPQMLCRCASAPGGCPDPIQVGVRIRPVPRCGRQDRRFAPAAVTILMQLLPGLPAFLGAVRRVPHPGAAAELAKTPRSAAQDGFPLPTLAAEISPLQNGHAVTQ